MITQFEEAVKKCMLDGNLEEIWASYLVTRRELIDEVISVIGTQEPNLSDHCERHIENVHNNVGRLLGLSEGQFSVTLPVTELIAAMVAVLLHDIGNIEGRQAHNRAIPRVLDRLSVAKSVWSGPDLKAIERICKAHTGVAQDGSRDTVGALATQQTSFLGETILAGRVAALIRYADELAEGPQRTSKYLLRTKKYGKDAQLFHLYAHITHMNIDFAQKRIFVDYHVNIDEEIFGRNKKEKQKCLNRLLIFTQLRATKLEAERRYNRHYAPSTILFRETAVNYTFVRGSAECDYRIEPFVLNDLATSEGGVEKPFSNFEAMNVKDTVSELLRE